ncbi:short-chain dehydrogenase/reductase [Bordetella ansorpii]|uniref:Short-chain dehydrogenase/reductase n=1 Tax=Bordetella ansorpii TaxID=288768 RepID=A0A146AG65_9BORD|nr:SDR family oxidoreductase [Bordetella ansorpii]CZZ87639.1 short-chain dehydrogenase/reductase [Bordetella ansorpii]SAI65510.1 short-chain dehydrogenase/reductase [Bordetella ansorpii]
MKDTVFITGATSGFGAATARRFAAQGWRVIITGRRQERLQALAHELGEQAFPLVVDVRDRQAMQTALDTLPTEFSTLRALVNNAGLALGTAPAQACDLDDWDTMVDTNIKGLLYATRLLLPRLIAHGAGAGIVNLGSIAGNWPYPGSHVYGATKAFVRQFSLNLRCDLAGTGVRVTNLEPGMSESEFSLVRFGGDAQRADAVYRGVQPITPEDIAETIHWILSRPAHLNINSVEVMPVQQSWSNFAVQRD